MRATSLRRNAEPSGFTRNRIFSNSASELKRPSVVIEYTSCWSVAIGVCPTLPAANCEFCSLMARTMSWVVKLSCAIRSGFNHTRMA